MLQALDRDVLDLLLDEIEGFVTGDPVRRRSPGPDVAGASADVGGSPGHDPPGGTAAADASAEDAIAELERCRELLASGEDGLAGVVARAEAIVAAARGSWSESEARFVKAADTFRRYGLVWQEAWTLQSWGDQLRKGADRRAAIEKLDETIEAYRRRAASPGRDAGDPPSGAVTPRAVFRREGDYWTASWRDNVVRLKTPDPGWDFEPDQVTIARGAPSRSSIRVASPIPSPRSRSSAADSSKRSTTAKPPFRSASAASRTSPWRGRASSRGAASTSRASRRASTSSSAASTRGCGWKST
jgi:hypothetical protein